MFESTNTLVNYREKTDLLWYDIQYNFAHDDRVLFFILYNELINYNLGLFKLEAKNNITPKESVFYEYENKLLYYLIKYNELFITFFNDELQFWTISEKFYNGITLIYVKAQLLNLNQQLNYYSNYKIVDLFENIHGLYIRWDMHSMPFLIRYYKYINLQIDFFKAWKTSVFLDNKKFIYNVNNNSDLISTREVESMLVPDQPFIFNINPFTEDSSQTANILTEINKGPSTSEITYLNLTNLRNLFKDIYGFALPKDYKAERKNLTESITENYVSENTESIILKNLNTFLQKAKKLWHVDLKFIKNQDIILNQTEEIKSNNVNLK